MSTYTTANVKTTLSGYTSSNYRTFASDCSSNWVNAFTSRWTLSSRFQTSLGNAPSPDRTAFITALNNVADQIDAGISIDVSGLSISDSGSGSTPTTHWILHTSWEVVYTGATPIIVLVNFYWTHQNT